MLRRLPHAEVRSASSWLAALWGGAKKKKEDAKHPEVRPTAVPKLPAHDCLRSLSQQYFPEVRHWKDAPLRDLHVKAKILIAMESQCGKSIPDSQLTKLATVGDVLSYFQRRRVVARHHTLFPDIPRGVRLPDNLSLQTDTSKRRPSPRQPFQNYSREEHARFPSKLEKEAGKKRRRQ